MVIPSACETTPHNVVDIPTILKHMGKKEKLKDDSIKFCIGFEKCELHEGDGKTIDDVFEEEEIGLKKKLY